MMERKVFKYLVTAWVFFWGFVTPLTSAAQEANSFFRGVGIEIGGGYNQLFWDATESGGRKLSVDVGFP
jgi:hypothetical protein